MYLFIRIRQFGFGIGRKSAFTRWGRNGSNKEAMLTEYEESLFPPTKQGGGSKPEPVESQPTKEEQTYSLNYGQFSEAVHKTLTRQWRPVGLSWVRTNGSTRGFY
jgi:hypothetical protein